MAVYKIENGTFNSLERSITVDSSDEIKKLSQSEVYILAYLLENQGRVIDKNELLTVGWPKKVVVINSLTVAISNLRKALENPDVIVSNKGIGYTFPENITVEHNYLDDEIDDEIIAHDYIINKTKNGVMQEVSKKKHSFYFNIYFYLSIISFIFSSLFAFNWFQSYVSG